MRQTIKSYVYEAYKEGISAEDTWRAAQSLFPDNCVSWSYVVRLRRSFREGERIAEEFAKPLQASRAS